MSASSFFHRMQTLGSLRLICFVTETFPDIFVSILFFCHSPMQWVCSLSILYIPGFFPPHLGFFFFDQIERDFTGA